MIVYGDPHYEASMPDLLAHLREECQELLNDVETGMQPLDALRKLLIESGQVEQAIHDGLPSFLSAEESAAWIRCIEEVTDYAAAAFYNQWMPENGSAPSPNIDPTIPQNQPSPPSQGRAIAVLPRLSQKQEKQPSPPARGPAPAALPRLSQKQERGRKAALLEMEHALTRMAIIPTVNLTVKRPEGFAFYALYPEQYCMAALRWAEEHRAYRDQPAIVVGVRSIGTSLSAVVLAALQAEGWMAHRLTLRPDGHPFERNASLSPEQLAGAQWGLVVDEGPGMSGSSMAAAGKALEQTGIDRSHVSFLPGHGGEPGPAASDEVRKWWSGVRRYSTAREDLRWNGLSLPEALARAALQIAGMDRPVKMEDMGGGLWRQFVYPGAEEWPAVCVPFEMSKYRCTSRNGMSLLWKFEGFNRAGATEKIDADNVRSRRAVLEAEGWVAPHLGAAYGFVAYPWIDGTPLTSADASEDILSHIGRYLVRSAGPPLSNIEIEKGLARLQEMLYSNTREALGEEAASQSLPLKERAESAPSAEELSYRDGRMAPHEWLRTASGRVMKVDYLGHDNDHTIIGPQALTWDVAGVFVEWDLDDGAGTLLLNAMDVFGGIPSVALHFYQTAYTAFRMGQCSLCAGMNNLGQDEVRRLWTAYARYRTILAKLLGVEAGM